jgi:hypothetical protein
MKEEWRGETDGVHAIENSTMALDRGPKILDPAITLNG